jgi:hypothetical protein
MFKLRCLKTLMFCFVEDNKIISGIVIYNYGPGLRTTDFKTLSVVRGCRPGDNLLSSPTLYMFELFTGLSPSLSNFYFYCVPFSLTSKWHSPDYVYVMKKKKTSEEFKNPIVETGKIDNLTHTSWIQYFHCKQCSAWTTF